jgi:hypothetical protein
MHKRVDRKLSTRRLGVTERAEEEEEEAVKALMHRLYKEKADKGRVEFCLFFVLVQCPLLRNVNPIDRHVTTSRSFCSGFEIDFLLLLIVERQGRRSKSKSPCSKAITIS